ncbi:hypothetical protein J4H86_12505 [Spiractinospora alimapuensis]|uniref:hypothetical protein n=1 Tax=Spiractinospora alimapuensis TaxID=2820884 RepID=UPI001F3CDBB3|nr:hypothetical protein [Spiractinospora alimapuensis]QVQ54416.1 hypothetical protein J4H86_12505 [Spiractinospora alimapuensis]
MAPLPRAVLGVNAMLRMQTACPATFAALVLDAEPLVPEGEGIEFLDATSPDPPGGPVPEEYVRAIESGTRAALTDPTTGQPLYTAGLILRHVRWHEVDSNERDFTRAGTRAAQEVLACVTESRAPRPIRGR